MRIIKLSKTSLTACAMAFAACAVGQVSSEDRARAYYFEAEEALADGRVKDAEEYHDEAVSLLGGSNPKLAALETRILFKAGRYEEARKALDRFFASDAGASLEREMTPYLVRIDEAIKERDARAERESLALIEKGRRNLDSDVVVANQAFDEYIRRFPDGAHIDEARAASATTHFAAKKIRRRNRLPQEIDAGMAKLREAMNYEFTFVDKKGHSWRRRNKSTLQFDTSSCQFSGGYRADTWRRKKNKANWEGWQNQIVEGGATFVSPRSDLIVRDLNTKIVGVSIRPMIFVQPLGVDPKKLARPVKWRFKPMDGKSGYREDYEWAHRSFGGWVDKSPYDRALLYRTMSNIADLCGATLKFSPKFEPSD